MLIKQKNIRLIASDIDGTLLLNSVKTISPLALSLIRKLKEKRF